MFLDFVLDLLVRLHTILALYRTVLPANHAIYLKLDEMDLDVKLSGCHTVL